MRNNLFKKKQRVEPKTYMICSDRYCGVVVVVVNINRNDNELLQNLIIFLLLLL